MKMMSVPMKGQNKIKIQQEPCMHLSLPHLYRPYCSVPPFATAPKLFTEGMFQENEWYLQLKQEQVCKLFDVTFWKVNLIIVSNIIFFVVTNSFPKCFNLTPLDKNLFKLVGILLGILWYMPVCSSTYTPNFFFFKIKIWTQYAYVLQ